MRTGGGVGKKHSAADHFGVQDLKAKMTMLGFPQGTSQSATRPLGIDGLLKCSLDLWIIFFFPPHIKIKIKSVMAQSSLSFPSVSIQ